LPRNPCKETARLWKKSVSCVQKFVKLAEMNARSMIMIIAKDVQKHASSVLKCAAVWHLKIPFQNGNLANL
jgi:hypothetical protein